jgi:aldose 1-epimerase
MGTSKFLKIVLAHAGVALTLLFSLIIFANPLFAAKSSGKDHPTEAQVESSQFGVLDDGTQVEAYTLHNAHGASAKIITYGATLTELWIPDRSGKTHDVVLGYDNLKSYIGGRTWFGATVGRVANRIGGGKFTVDGKEYSVERNDGPNSLHGGSIGLSHVVWKAQPAREHGVNGVRFSYTSKDGEGGYPGTLNVEVLYQLTDANELKIEYSATTDKTTPVNLTNHSYFNLDGAPDVLKYLVTINASHYTPVDATLIPTGEILPVTESPLDLTSPKVIGARISELKLTHGYDHNYVLNDSSAKLKKAARVEGASSGIMMEVWTTEPAVQFYTGNFLDGTLIGKRGVVYGKNAALCLETQHFPDAVNHPNFPSILLQPGKRFHSETIYKFFAQ